MDRRLLTSILADFKEGKRSLKAVLEALTHLPYEDLDFAKVDHHRTLRTAVPEVIFAKGKKTEEVVPIAQAMLRRGGRFLITRATEEVYRALGVKTARYYPASGVISCGESRPAKGMVLVLSAGTSDIPVAEEAEVTASFLGSRTERLYDVGVAGVHRLLAHRKLIQKARAVIVVAGMEGALPSVVGGLINSPVIAVPTSVGYGTSLGGLTALFAMLNSCVPGIAVVNIDNGFGAGCLAHKINSIGFSKAKPEKKG
ncbi:MAG TPA: nickel pincer cofactor biosynthesis protein LarB [Dissulfurispiraceae bacterium]|nr:nickel pincer cofactor biosynthesis protein LarB [Dissulfurispiraceae bacterium]